MRPRTGSLVLFVIIASFATGQATHHHRHRSASTDSLRGRLGGLQGKKRDLRNQIHQTRAAAQGVKHTIVVVDDRLEAVQLSLAETQRDLGKARRQQADAATEVERAKSDLDLARTRARARLRAIGKGNDANLLAAFVGSQSVGDLTDQNDTMARIARRDHEIFDRVVELRQTVERKKRDRDTAVRQVASLEGRERSQQADLRLVRARKGRELQGLRAKEADQEEALQQFEDDEREIRRLISLSEAAERARIARAHREGRKATPAPAFIGRFLRPLNAPVTSGFGMRFHPILHIYRLHAGVDFGAPIGTPVRCAAPGEVVAATTMRGFGNVVIVDHGGGVQTVYGHLSRIAARAGTHIAQGQVLGAVGNSGLSTGPHLHWEVHIGGRAVNPMGRF